ncbi:MAG: hypothetical protein ABW217_00105 [Polyangiaceae bacterium]
MRATASMLGVALLVALARSAAAQEPPAAAPAQVDTNASEATETAAGASAADVQTGPSLGWGTARAGERKRWSVSGEAQLRMLLVSDADPSNDRSMSYRVQGGYELLDWLTLLARAGVDQRFVAEEGESGLGLQDTLLAALAAQTVSLAPLGWARTVSLRHRLGLYLPTSRESRRQDLYSAGEWLTQARLEPIARLACGLRGVLQYRLHEYAEQAGPGGRTLPRFVVEGLVFVEYSPLVSTSLGTLTLGADAYGYESVDYPARPQGSFSDVTLPDGVEVDPAATSGAQASDVYAAPHYGYDLYVNYVPPLALGRDDASAGNFALTASLSQGGNVLRNGEPRVFFFNRDETVLAFKVAARY